MTGQDGPDPGTTPQPVAERVADVRPQVWADVTGVITSDHPMSLSGTPACRYTLTDGTGELDLLFLGRVLIAGLVPGSRCRVQGRAAVRDDRIVIWNPRYWLDPADAPREDRSEPCQSESAREEANRTEADASAWAPSQRMAAGLRHNGSVPPRILVVDADMATRQRLRASLQASGNQVDLAATATHAIELARGCPDLVLLDVALPDLDPLATITAIRTECDAPIIAMGGTGAPTTRRAVFGAGAVDYLSKPVDTALLTIKVARLRRGAERVSAG